MASPPKVTALLICEGTVRDTASDRTTVVAVYDFVAFDSFPAVHGPFSIYFKVTSLNGEYDFRLEVVSPDGALVLGGGNLPPPIACRDPLASIDVGVRISRIRLATPGQYSIRLLYNGVIAETATLNVTHP